MKKNLLLASVAAMFLLVAGIPTANAQSIFAIFGQVTDANGNAMANHDVNISSDSSSAPWFYYWNTVQTNAQGYYGDTITGFGPGNIVFYVGTQDCPNGYQSATVQNNQGATQVVNQDFQLNCNGGPVSTPCDGSFTAYYDAFFASGGTESPGQ